MGIKRGTLTKEELAIVTFLEKHHLMHLFDILKGNGFDELDLVLEIQQDHMIQMEISPQDQMLLLNAIQHQASESEEEVYEDVSEHGTPSTPQVTTSVVLQPEALKRPTSGLSSTYDTGRALDISKQSLSRKTFYEQVNTGTQAGVSLQAEKVSCWTCFSICAKNLELSDQTKYFCSQKCLERGIGEYKACCPTCKSVKPKRDCILFDSKYYCSKKCKPAIEDVASNLANLVRDMRKTDPNLATEEILSSVFQTMTGPGKNPINLSSSGAAADDLENRHEISQVTIHQKPEQAAYEDSRHLLQRRPSSILRDRGSSARQGETSQRGLTKRVSFVQESEGKSEKPESENGGDSPRKDSANGVPSKIEDLKRAKKESFHKFHDLEGFGRSEGPAELKSEETKGTNHPAIAKEVALADRKPIKSTEELTQQSWNQKESLAKRLGICTSLQTDSRAASGFTGRQGPQITETHLANAPNINNFISKTVGQAPSSVLQLSKPRDAAPAGSSSNNLPRRQLLHQKGEETAKEPAAKKLTNTLNPVKRRSSGQEVLNLGITGEVVSLTDPKRENRDIKIRQIDVTQGKRSYSKPQSPSLQLDITPAKVAIGVESQRPMPRSQSKDGSSITSAPTLTRVGQVAHPSSLPRAPKSVAAANTVTKPTVKDKQPDASLDQESTHHQSSTLSGPPTPSTFSSKHSLPKVPQQKESGNQLHSLTTLQATPQTNSPLPQMIAQATPKYPSDFGGWQDPFPEHTEADLTDSLLVECRNRAEGLPSEP